jgi:hypothetical protein
MLHVTYSLNLRVNLSHLNNHTYKWICGPGSSVGIATDYGLDGPGIESR